MENNMPNLNFFTNDVKKWDYGNGVSVNYIEKYVYARPCIHRFKFSNDQQIMEEYFKRLDEVLTHNLAICIIPTHDPAQPDSAIKRLAKKLASEKSRIDATSCLVRVKKTERRYHGGSRDESITKHSIGLRDSEILFNKQVLLLDDVAKTGNSLKVCKSKIKRAKPISIELLVLAAANVG